MDYKEEQKRREKCEFELYQSLVHSDKEEYVIQEGQTELTYEQRMLYLYTERKFFQMMERDLKQESANKKPSEILKEKYQVVMNAYIPAEKQEAFLQLFDHYTLFSYIIDIQGRSDICYQSYSFLMHMFMDFKMNKEFGQNGMQTAIELCESGLELEAAIEQKMMDILYQKNESIRPEAEITSLARGIIISRNEKLIHMLIEQVKNKKLKEDYRLNLCLIIASGSIDNFLQLLQVLIDNQMAKFRSVRRCVAIWTGLYAKKTYEAITDDTLVEMQKVLVEFDYRKQLLQSDNSRSVFLGIWAEGCSKVERAMETGIECMKTGSAQARMAVAYYAMKINNFHFTTELMEIALEQSQSAEEDKNLLAVLLCSYLRSVETTVGEFLDDTWFEGIRSRVPADMLWEQARLTYEEYFVSEEQARKHFSLLNQLYKALPKKKYFYTSDELPIEKACIFPGEMVVRMLLIAYILKDDNLIDTVCPLISSIDSDYRSSCFDICCQKPRTATQRMTIIQALKSKDSSLKNSANVMLMEDFDHDKKEFRSLQFTDEEWEMAANELRKSHMKVWFGL